MNGDQYTGDGLYTEKNAGDDLYSGSGTYTGSTYGTGGLSVGGNTVKDRENTNAKAAALPLQRNQPLQREAPIRSQ